MNRYHLFFTALLSMLLIATAFLVEFRTDVSDFFFRGDSPETALIASSIQSGELAQRYILLIETRRDDADITVFAQALEAKLKTVDHVVRIWGMQRDQQVFESILANYIPYRMQLFSPDPEKDIAHLFQEETLQTRAGHIKSVLLSSEGARLKSVILQDPLLLTGDWASKLGFGSQETADKNFSGLIVETAVSGLDAQAQRPIYASILKTFDALNAQYKGDFSLRITGVPLFSIEVQKQVSQDVQRVSMLSVTMMILLFLSVFRSIRGLFWISLILISTVAASSLITSLMFGYIHALTMAIGTTLIGVCVDYPIHAIVHASGSNEADSEASTRRIWPSLLLGGLTTVTGYIALSFTSYPGMQQIALFAGVGIATALLLTRYILPHLMQGHIREMQPRIEFGAWLRLLHHYRSSMRLVVIGGGLIFFMIGFSGLNWMDDLNSLSPSLTELKAEDQAIRSHMSSVEPGRFILVQANDFETALQINESVFIKLQALKKEGTLKSFHSLYPWLASAKLQRENLNYFKGNMTAENRELWQQALRAEGLSVKHLGQLKMVETELLSREKFESWPYKHYVSGQYVIQNGQVLIMTWLGMHDADKTEAVVSDMAGVRYVSQRDIVNHLAVDYRTQTMKMLLLGAFAIFVLLVIRFRHVFIAMNILFPALMSVFIVMGAWGVFGETMGMLHLIGLLLVVAICVDYGIFFYENRAGNQALTFQAIVISSMTTAAAFFSLGFAENPALQALAWSVAPGVVIGFLLCPLLIRQQQIAVQESK